MKGLTDRERAVAAPGDPESGCGAGSRRGRGLPARRRGGGGETGARSAPLRGPDVLVNNAGVGGPQKPIGEITAEEWGAPLEHQPAGGLLLHALCRAGAFRAAKGSIVNLASILGLGGRGTGLSLTFASTGGW